MHVNFEAKINFVSFKRIKRIRDCQLCMLKLPYINVGDINKVGVPIYFSQPNKNRLGLG